MAPQRFPDCATARLHEIGRVQPLGCLVAVAADSGRITHCSDNTARVLGCTPECLLGTPAVEVFGTDWPRLAALATSTNRVRTGRWTGAMDTTVAGHRSGGHCILEFEPPLLPEPTWWDASARMEFIEDLATIDSQETLWRALTDWVFEVTGYDRVMVYRFLPNWDGEVVHERCRDGVQGFLGLRFPAGDIPPNARRLYRSNRQRIIGDVAASDAAILTSTSAAPPLDMTMATLRAVHPVHIQYLSNMGVRSSFSLSLIVDGELWGMIACHHRTPKVHGIRTRLALEELIRLASLHLANLVHLDGAAHRSALHERLALLGDALDASGGDAGNLEDHLSAIREMLGADGVWLNLATVEATLGEVPENNSRRAILAELKDAPPDRATHWQRLPERLRHDRALARFASGLLYLPLATHGALLALRREAIEVVRWAGRGSDNGEPETSLSPRHSFRAWSQQVRFQAEPWGVARLEIAEMLRGKLIEHLRAVREKDMAYRDPVTGLANRYSFEASLKEALSGKRETDRRLALHIVDLDHFKPVNDRLGHAAGDDVLRAVAARLASLVRQEDLVARLGGDEFAVIQRGIADPVDADDLSARIVDLVAQPIAIGHEQVEVGASVGVALYPDSTDSLAELQERADQALYSAKNAGRGVARRFDTNRVDRP